MVVRYSHAVGDAHDGIIAADRLLRIERSKHYLAFEEYRSVPLYVSTVPNTPRVEDADRVLFAEFLEDVISNYKLVAAMNVVDCAVVTQAVSERGSRYSTLPYMSMWYAHVPFESLRRIASEPPTRGGPTYKRAGMWDELSLVSVDGCLALDVDLILSKMARVHSTGVQGGVSTLRDAVRHDLEYDARAASGDAISDLRDIILTARCRVWEAIAKATAVVHERDYREDDLKALVRMLSIRST